MKDILVSIVLSIISSFCYDAIKTIISELKNRRKLEKSEYSISYSAKYIKAIKKQFYICFPLGILFLIFTRTKYSFLNTFNGVMSFWMFVLSLFAFMCSIEAINHFTNKNSDNNAQ